MLKALSDEEDGGEEEEEAKEQKPKETWLFEYWKDFRRRFLSLLSFEFRKFLPGMSLNILQQKQYKEKVTCLTSDELDMHMTKYDLKRLEMYANNMVDYHLIMDLLPTAARLLFLHKLNVQLSVSQSAILLGLGLQHKSVDDLVKELDLPATQLLGLFNRSMKKLVQHLNDITASAIEKTMAERKEITMTPTAQTVDEDLEEASEEVKEKQKKDFAVLKGINLTQYAIKGSESEWNKALTAKDKKLISIGHNAPKRKVEETPVEESDGKSSQKKKKHKKFKK